MEETRALVAIAGILAISFTISYRRGRKKGLSKLRSFFWY
jgi:hypothetical protein